MVLEGVTVGAGFWVIDGVGLGDGVFTVLGFVAAGEFSADGDDGVRPGGLV